MSARRATAAGREFLASTDNWFRPVQFANGPDGAIYVIDMYRETIEHPLSLPPVIKQRLDLNSGRDRGRIYRIVPDDWRPPRRPLPGAVDDEALAEMLAHPNGWQRETAARLIVQRAADSPKRRTALIDALERQCDSTNSLARVRALYCLVTLDACSEALLLRLLSDEHPQVRRHALKTFAELKASSAALVAKLQTMTDDPDAWVRRQLALTAGEFTWDGRRPILAALASNAADPSLRFALLSAMGDRRVEMLKACLEAYPVETLEPAWLEEVVRQIGRGRTQLDEALLILTTQAGDSAPHLTGALLLGTERTGASLRQLLQSHGVEDAASIVARTSESAHFIALKESIDLPTRLDAIRLLALAGFSAKRDAFEELLSPRQAAEIRAATVAELGRFSDAGAAELLLSYVRGLPPQARRRAVDFLVSRSAWAKLLLNRIADGDLSATLISTQQRLILLRHRNAEVAYAAEKLLGVGDDRAEVVRRMSNLLDRRGDVVAGARLFRKVCATCHRLDGRGANVGPDLQPLRQRGAEFMLTQILDPNREVNARYEGYTVVADDGRVLTGLLIEDSATSITLLLADGEQVTLPKDETDEIVAAGRSLMPEGLEQELTEQGLVDVIAYLVHTAQATEQ